MQVDGYAQFGGRHGASAAIKNLLTFAGVRNPATGEPFSESTRLLEELRERIVALHRAETQAASCLRQAVA